MFLNVYEGLHNFFSGLCAQFLKLVSRNLLIQMNIDLDRWFIHIPDLIDKLIKLAIERFKKEEKLKTIAGYRSAIGHGMRSEKIRTYNFPQDRITDHRIKESWHNIEGVMAGDMQDIFDSLATFAAGEGE